MQKHIFGFVVGLVALVFAPLAHAQTATPSPSPTPISVTAASVAKSSAALVDFPWKKAGEAISGGKLVYYKKSTNRLYLADSDAGSAAAAEVFGIANAGCGIDAPCEIVLYDPAFNPGFTVVVGETYVLSTTAGNMTVNGGNGGSGAYTSVVGMGKTASALMVNFINSGATNP